MSKPKLSAPWDGRDRPPPWPLAKDPRTPGCHHEWDGSWAQEKGERQQFCEHCQRWIWQHSWWTVTTRRPPEPNQWVTRAALIR